MTEQKPGENSLADIRRFFATSEERQVKMDEFVEFWKACSEAEKEEFRHAKLT